MSSITDRKQIPNSLKANMELLTTKERSYFKMMWPKSGVLYITAKPGVAKSAIALEIATIMGYKYQDHRLSMKDETDLGLFPDKIEINGIKYLDFVVPIWAHRANQEPTIIHFEELNRSTQQVRNAALQLLLERGIGPDFKFNDNVLMIASGNLGDEDGTDVEEFDNALNGRLIHVKHELEYTEWLNGYANNNIHKSIVSFINSSPIYIYQNPVNDGSSKAYASPRTWTFLSDYIVCNYGPDADIQEFINDIKKIGHSYIGPTIVPFIKYCESLIRIGINDVINKFDEIETDLLKCDRSTISSLIQSLKKINIENLSTSQIGNVHKFVKIMREEEKMDYFLPFLDDIGDIGKNTKAFLIEYAELITNIDALSTRLNKGKSTETLKPSTKKPSRPRR